MKTKSSTATAAPVAPAAGLKRINLAGIATKAPAAKAAKTYPELPDPDGQVAALVEGILEKTEQLEALEGALNISKGELIAIAKPFYFTHHAGQMAVASSVEAKAGDKLVRVGFSNSYRGTTDDVAILRVTGENGASFFKQSFELKIKGGLIPEAAAEEIIGELQAPLARHNAGAALSAKAVFKPTKEFHTSRHRINFELRMLNFEFNQLSGFQFPLFLPVVPVAASVKTKLGRGGGSDE
jgi:hypothetical protein